MNSFAKGIGCLWVALSASQLHAGFYFNGLPKAASQSGAAAAGHVDRCADDALVSNEDAIKRQDWAHSCGLVDKNKWGRRYKYSIDLVTGAESPRAKQAYPVFVYNKPGFPIYHPSADCNAFPKDGSVIFFNICQAGCYSGDQLISLVDAEKIEARALQGGHVQTLKTLSAGSLFEDLVYKGTPLANVVRSVRAGMENMIRFRLASGGELYVTEEHAIVDGKSGAIRPAHLFVKGDYFIREDGLRDEIVSIASEQKRLRVFNVLPASQNELENIVIAQGYLNGSQMYQDGLTHYLSKLAKRESVPGDLID